MKYDPKKRLMKPANSNKFNPANKDPPRYSNDRRWVHRATSVNDVKITAVDRNAVGTILEDYNSR